MKSLVFAGLILSSLIGFSQNGKIFKGSYSINKSKISWDGVPEYVLPTEFDIKPEKNHVTILRKMVNPDGSKKDITENIKYDGTASKRETPSGIASASLLWINDSSFKVEKEWTDKEGKSYMKATEIWTKEDGGKSLKVSYAIEQTDGNNYTIVGYFDKN